MAKEKSYGWMGIDMPRSVALRIAMIQRAIAKEDLYDEDGFGLEKHPHVTLAYGHEEDDPRSTKEAIKEILQGQGTVGGLSHFDQGDYKVLKFDVDSPDLHALNKAVRAGVKMPGETFKTYRPHVTVAYLKKDVDPAKYAPLANFVSGRKFPISAIRWSNPADRYSTILLPRLAKTAAEVEHGVAKGQDMELQPTEAQIKAENYKKAHVTIDGLDISIENPFKSVRSGVDPDGNEWSQQMWDDYGYIRGSRGYDKDHLDVFINPGIPHDETIWDAESVYVINQLDADGRFDEHKCMIGYVTKQQAVQAYKQNYEDGWDRDGSVVELPWAEFKEWAMSDGPTKGELKPLAKQAATRTYHMDIRAIDREIRLKQRLADPRLRKIAKIVLDIEMGDTVLVGRFKNKPVKVESIGTDENGQPTINGRKLLALRIKKLLPGGGPVAATTSAKAKQLKKQADDHFRLMANPSLRDRLVVVGNLLRKTAIDQADLHKKALKYDPSQEWIGVDLDGTLAKYTEWKGRGHIGAPIKPMVARVKAWLDAGKNVKILTARASGDDGKARYHIDKWCMAHIGRVLPITCVKDMYCTAIYDDKARGVTKNTGKIKTMVNRPAGK